MRDTVAAVLGSAVLTVATIGGIAALASGPAAPAGPAAARPIAPPKATVPPDVAEEMNGPHGKVTMGRGVPMRPARPVDRLKLAGKGQGNGCTKGYGRPGQCLPLRSPAQVAMPDMDHPWTCPEVRQLFPTGVAVMGRDTLGLDSNGDRVACGQGDG